MIADSDWLTLLLACHQRAEPVVLVTVARARGSTPREVGARMAISAKRLADSIGGGHLEYQAIAYARQMLVSTGRSRQLQRWSLGASLGQCCGGVVWLNFERLERHDHDWLLALQQARAEGVAWRRELSFVDDTPPQHRLASATENSLLAADDSHFVDVLPALAAHIVLCGAGHVGQALVDVMAALPWRVLWLDARDDVFPARLPPNVQCCQGDASDVPTLPAQAYWLVLTHNHKLDFELVHAILQRGDARFVGMIGSASKRTSFKTRLLARLSPQQLAPLVCPIGISGIHSKQPAAIAVAVVAQLLQLITATPSTLTPSLPAPVPPHRCSAQRV
ncbi:xanthine dehydrogenase accessory protein XdhC [Neisseriaceae bacterium TC5R-5]|nr:xanthine dehydrogenase accessory protein XdhC [Neisseriaceae bacterium TC5R-5]